MRMNTCANVTSKNVELFPVIQDQCVMKTQTSDSQFLSPKMFYGHTMFIQVTATCRKAVESSGYKTDFNLNNIISTLSFYFFRKIFASKCVGLYFKTC